jgi:hypothetical protein
LEFEPIVYTVLIKVDSESRITEIDSSAFLVDTTGWVQIDEGVGDKYHHAQGNYLPAPLYDERFIPRYTYVPDGDPKWRERTQEEMDADYVPPQPVKTVDELAAENELLRAQVQALSDRGEFIEDCIAEMAMQVYQ